MKSSAILSTKAPSRTPARLPRKTFALTGPRVDLDPRTHAVRRDLADVRLTEYVFAPHYAAPLARVLLAATALRESPAEDAATLAELQPGDTFELLDVTSGMAWGMATREGIVGYLPADLLGADEAAAA